MMVVICDLMCPGGPPHGTIAKRQIIQGRRVCELPRSRVGLGESIDQNVRVADVAEGDKASKFEVTSLAKTQLELEFKCFHFVSLP